MADRVRACRNIQDELHAEDPGPAPAHLPQRLQPGASGDLRPGKEPARGDGRPRSSTTRTSTWAPTSATTDQAAARFGDEPAYPVEYVVVDVKSDGTHGARQFAWDETAREVPGGRPYAEYGHEALRLLAQLLPGGCASPCCTRVCPTSISPCTWCARGASSTAPATARSIRWRRFPPWSWRKPASGAGSPVAGHHRLSRARRAPAAADPRRAPSRRPAPGSWPRWSTPASSPCRTAPFSYASRTSWAATSSLGPSLHDPRPLRARVGGGRDARGGSWWASRSASPMSV